MQPEVLKLTAPSEPTPQAVNGERHQPASLEPLLIGADVAGPMCGRSEPSWWRDHAKKRIPAPIKLGGRTLWRTEELRRWVEAGCPDRRTWEALRAACNEKKPRL